MKQVWLRRQDRVLQQKPKRENLRRQMAWAAGTDSVPNRDPLYHVTEDFHQTFDALGRRHTEELLHGQPSKEPPQQQKNDRPSARSFYEQRTPEEQQMLHQFSETAFQRGTLSGAVLEGTGQMMLVSCLKKTVGQSQPDKWQQRKLFASASTARSVPGDAPMQVVFNRGFSDSAIGLVVDTLRDARRTVETMQKLAGSVGELGSREAETLRTMYPCLDDSRERTLLMQYRAALEEPSDPTYHTALQSAVGRMEALISKKAQMRTEFLNKLRFLSDRANEALEAFSAPTFSEQVAEQLQQTTAEPPPEEDGRGTPTGNDTGDGQTGSKRTDDDPTDR